MLIIRVVRILCQKLRFCMHNLQILCTIFVNSVQILHSWFFQFKFCKKNRNVSAQLRWWHPPFWKIEKRLQYLSNHLTDHDEIWYINTARPSFLFRSLKFWNFKNPTTGGWHFENSKNRYILAISLNVLTLLQNALCWLRQPSLLS